LLYVDGGEELEDIVHDHDVGFLEEVCSVQQVVMYNLVKMVVEGMFHR
jgi:hypothetical protein